MKMPIPDSLQISDPYNMLGSDTAIDLNQKPAFSRAVPDPIAPLTTSTLWIPLVPVKVHRIHPEARMPEYAHETDSCFDIFSVEIGEIEPGDLRKFRTGISIQADLNWDFQFESKSGLAQKGISVRGGTIDSGYTGELAVILCNEGYERHLIEPGDKLAQVRIQPRYRAVFTEMDGLEPRDRGQNGFGSTGQKGRTQ